jgi:hypothetical protein
MPTVGDEVLFTPSVSGGAPGSFSYLWDFNDDGEVDSTDPNPTHVYNSPYVGDVFVEIVDSQDCAEFKRQSLTVDGPIIVFSSVVNPVEIDGNSNGFMDPGETWEIDIQLVNVGNLDAFGVSASLTPAPDNPGGVAMLQDSALFGDLPLGVPATSQQSYRFIIGQGFPCGEQISLTVTQISSVDPDNVYPDDVGAVKLHVGGAGPPVVIFEDGFEHGGTWLAEGDDGEWEIDAPAGLGGNGLTPDPSLAFDGDKVLGNDLTGLGANPGDYENDLNTSVVSASLDLTEASDVSIQFARWLNVAVGDRAIVVAEDVAGGDSVTVFNVASGVTETDWQLVDYDVSSVADGSPEFKVKFSIVSDGVTTQSGWNIDAFKVLGVTPQSCSPVSHPGPGVVEELQIDLSEAGELELQWTPDCAQGTAYTVYRGDLLSGYDSAAPESCDYAGTSAVLPQGGPAEFFFVVPSDGVFEGSYGLDGSGSPRPPLASACYPQDVYDACGP